MVLSCLNAGPFLTTKESFCFLPVGEPLDPQWTWKYSKNQNNFVCQVNSDKWKKEKENFNQIVSAVNCYHYPLQPIDKDILPNDYLLKKKKKDDLYFAFLAVQNSSIGDIVTHWVSRFWFWYYRVTLETCDLWDIWSKSWGDMTWLKKDLPAYRVSFSENLKIFRKSQIFPKISTFSENIC